MNKIFIVAAAAMTLTATLAQADPYHRHRHQAQNHQYQHRSHGWGAPLLGGLIVGGIVGGLMAQPYLERSRCPYGTERRMVSIVDEYGRYVGDRAVCAEY